MVEDLCFHLLDLAQNSAAAGAQNISLTITDPGPGGPLTLMVEDDGRGMDDRTLGKVQDPFFTSKSFKKVGLGIPLLKATAQLCGGEFRITSRVGSGTTVSASLNKGHVDCPPLGNLEDTLLGLLVSLDPIGIHFSYRGPKGEFALASAEIRKQVGDLHFSHPEIYRFLKDYIHEGLSRVLVPPG